MKVLQTSSRTLSNDSARGIASHATFGFSPQRPTSSSSPLSSAEATWKSNKKPMDGPMMELFRRISPLGDPKLSIVPVLDQWVAEGNSVERRPFLLLIKRMRSYRRHSHALEISMWMSDKRYISITTADAAVRLSLISKVHGVEQAEIFFDNLPQRLKVEKVYIAFLNCYAKAKLPKKAEALLEKMRHLGFPRSVLCFTNLLNLYYRTGDYNKVDALINEMDEEKIHLNRYIYSIWLSASTAASDTEKFEMILTRMKMDANFVWDWTTGVVVTSGYYRLGLLDKALEMLKKCEGLITEKTSNAAYDFLITQYAAAGNKDEVLRVWDAYKKKRKVYNKGYNCVMNSLLKFDDIESAEMILEQWMSSDLTCDIRIPNNLIHAYSKTGLLEKAETLKNKFLQKGGKLDHMTWYHLVKGYIQNNQMPEAYDAMKKAILVCPSRWKPGPQSLTACLESIIGEESAEEAKEFVELLRAKDIISVDAQNKLLTCVYDKKGSWEALGVIIDNALGDDAEAPGTLGEVDKSRGHGIAVTDSDCESFSGEEMHYMSTSNS
ncbi:pentatricopeptide repeat-containing protein At2g20710, mitochondrial-like [Rhodamnia argentea]|uniref:Pentatricopeptide repeat-containing protein At2g20710, mitochondrial-like n=1 Tax=Rhodamnia argentea TaxID=178133 RepID=A0A8B8MRE5_9MYRT|nr:pentatricopeptide repeat-containing protein At2g20710, mitochondrial-like [Rhodamnia argentea]